MSIFGGLLLDPFYDDRRGRDYYGTIYDDRIYGTDYDDDIDAGGGNDTVEGYRGDDLIAGKGGDDVLYGDRGRDTVTGGDGRDHIEGGSDNDRLGGGQATDTIHGDDGDDLIGGDGEADLLYGGDGRDTILGGAGNDTIRGGDDDDTLDGGTGEDVAEYDLDLDEVARERLDADTIRLRLPDGSDDELTGIERVRFDDAVLHVGDVTASEAFVFRMYDAVFDRYGDDGLDYWVDQLDGGMAEIAVSQAFIQSDEYEATYGDAPDLIKTLYLNVLGREADAGGRAYWQAQLDAGMTEAELLMAFTESPENVAASEETLETGMVYIA